MGGKSMFVISGLRTNRTMIVGVMIPDITNMLFPPIVRGIESLLEVNGYASILVNTDNDAARFDPQFVKPDGKTCRFNPWPYPIA